MKKTTLLFLIISTFLISYTVLFFSTGANLPDQGVFNYDFGKSVVNLADGKTMPFDLRGIIGVPEGTGKCPVVVIMHSSHGEGNDYYQGFEYLVRYLSGNGYLTLSIDISSQYDKDFGDIKTYERAILVFKKHIEKLKDAMSVHKSDYNADVFARADLNNISLVGHGAAGQAALLIGENELKNNSDIIKSIILAAPASKIDLGDVYPDIPTGIILPQFDKIVPKLDGADIFEAGKNDFSRKNFLSSVYVYGANHNYFNSMMAKYDDAKGIKTGRLNAEEQEIFFKDYVLDFLNAVVNKTYSKFCNLSLTDEFTGIAYGANVLPKYAAPFKIALIDASSSSNINNTSEITTQNVELSHVYDSYINKEDSAGWFTLPGSRQRTGLYKISFSTRGGVLTSKVNKLYQDFSSYHSLYLSLAPDSTSTKNKPDVPLEITVVVTDSSGNSARVVLDKNTPALKYQNGFAINVGGNTEWSAYTPLGGVNIPLSKLPNINLKEISSVSLLFDKNYEGQIMLSELSVLKK